MILLLGECEGLRGSLKQSQQLLNEAKQREETEHAKSEEKGGQAASAAREIEQVINTPAIPNTIEAILYWVFVYLQLSIKLQEAEQHIETLTSQLSDLGSSEAMQRVREQHESVVTGLRVKQDAEVLALRQEIDEYRRTIEQQVLHQLFTWLAIFSSSTLSSIQDKLFLAHHVPLL